MFSGEHVHVEENRVRKDVWFLLRNLVWPFPQRSKRFDVITGRSTHEEVLELSRQVADHVEETLDTSRPHRIRQSHTRDWSYSDREHSRSLIAELFESAWHLLKSWDVSREMFDVHVDVHQRMSRGGDDTVVEVVHGMSDRLGDGHRVIIGNETRFDQLKGNRNHTHRIYLHGQKRSRE